MKLYLTILSLYNPLAILLGFLLSFTCSWHFRKMKVISIGFSIFQIVAIYGSIFYIQNFDEQISQKYCSALNLEKDQCRAEISMKFEGLNFYLALRSKDTYFQKFLLLKTGVKEDLSKKDEYERSKFLILSLINKRQCGSFMEISSCVSIEELDSLYNAQKEVVLLKSKEFFNKKGDL